MNTWTSKQTMGAFLSRFITKAFNQTLIFHFFVLALHSGFIIGYNTGHYIRVQIAGGQTEHIDLNTWYIYTYLLMNEATLVLLLPFLLFLLHGSLIHIIVFYKPSIKSPLNWAIGLGAGTAYSFLISDVISISPLLLHILVFLFIPAIVCSSEDTLSKAASIVGRRLIKNRRQPDGVRPSFVADSTRNTVLE